MGLAVAASTLSRPALLKNAMCNRTSATFISILIARDLRTEDQSILQSDAQWLKAHPDVVVTIEGDADARGEIVYNVVLSDKRAENAKDALVSMGVPASQIVFATGWGKLYPVCSQDDETCWSQNRRAHFSAW